MAHSTICPRCSRIRPCSCPPARNPRKAMKAKIKRYNSAGWRRTRQLALARDGHRCRDCGSTTDLTVDLLHGNDHSRARLEDCVTRCRACHGRKDGGRRPAGG